MLQSYHSLARVLIRMNLPLFFCDTAALSATDNASVSTWTDSIKFGNFNIEGVVNANFTFLKTLAIYQVIPNFILLGVFAYKVVVIVANS